MQTKKCSETKPKKLISRLSDQKALPAPSDINQFVEGPLISRPIGENSAISGYSTKGRDRKMIGHKIAVS